MTKYRIHVWPSSLIPGIMYYTVERKGLFFWSKWLTYDTEEQARKAIEVAKGADTKTRIIKGCDRDWET